MGSKVIGKIENKFPFFAGKENSREYPVVVMRHSSCMRLLHVGSKVLPNPMESVLWKRVVESLFFLLAT